MDKRGWIVWVSIALVVVLIGSAFFYFALFNRDNSSVYSSYNLKNPIGNLSDEEAVLAFDESFVFYLLYEIKAYNLHNPPFSSDIPRIEINVGDDVFGATVDRGIINVTKGRIAKRDIIITTTKSEAVKMLRDKSYVVKSFNDKMSSIELVADRTTLFAKGYLGMYSELTGNSITGNVIRILAD